jgi:hypothetical protein
MIAATATHVADIYARSLLDLAKEAQTRSPPWRPSSPPPTSPSRPSGT